MTVKVEVEVCLHCGWSGMVIVDHNPPTLNYDCPGCGRPNRCVGRSEKHDQARSELRRAKSDMNSRHRKVLEDFVAHLDDCQECRRGMTIEGEWAKMETIKMCAIGQVLGIPAARVLNKWGIP